MPRAPQFNDPPSLHARAVSRASSCGRRDGADAARIAARRSLSHAISPLRGCCTGRRGCVMGHYRLALSNWLRGKRRRPQEQREQHEKVETPVDRATSGSREPTWASVDVDAEEEEEDGDVPMLGGRDRRSVSESAVQKSTSMRNMRTFLAVGAPMQVQRGKQQRRSTWASWEQQQSGQQNEHEHKKKKTLGSRLQRRLSRQPSHVPEPASPRCVALTPSIIFIEC